MSSTSVLIIGGQGYVGSALASHLMKRSYAVQSIDIGLRGIPGPAPNLSRRYQDLSVEELAEFDNVILLAGHSTVAACAQAPAESFANNVGGFAELVHKLRSQLFLYASSIAVATRTPERPAIEEDPLPDPVAVYDLHKQFIERYARLVYPNAYSLRFGSVCGPSPNMRTELLLNSLVRSAMFQGRVEVANRQAHRPILGINDLCRSIETILTHRVPSGCYNLASANVMIGVLADWVAKRFGVPVIEVKSPTPYDIRVCTLKFQQASGMVFRDTMESVTDELVSYYTTQKG
jgi:nucleoside-diphosphate-sugar epimerase